MLEAGTKWRQRFGSRIAMVTYSGNVQIEYRFLDGSHSIWSAQSDFTEDFIPLDTPPEDDLETFTLPDRPMSEEAQAKYAGFTDVEQWRKAVG